MRTRFGNTNLHANSALFARPSVIAVALATLCLAVYLPGLLAMPVMDRDEARFAQASRQMLESALLPADQLDDNLHAGGLLIPRVGDTNRLNKPPAIYWLQSASVAVFTASDPTRDSIWMYRVPSLLAAVATVLMTFSLARTLYGIRIGTAVGALAACMLAVAPVFAWEAKQARADHVMVAATTAAMWALASIWMRIRRSQPIPISLAAGFWLALGLGIMTKGVPIVIACTTIASLCALSRSFRPLMALRPLLGVVILAACVLPWVIGVANRVGWSDYLSLIADETLGRSVQSKEGHWGPPGYHLVALAALFWPGSLLTAAAAVRAFRVGIRPAARAGFARWIPSHAVRAPEAFLIAWLIPAWLIFELVSTKLPHYTMPLYPAVALLTARAVVGFRPPARARLKALPGGVGGLILWTILGVAWAAAIGVGAVALQHLGVWSTDSRLPVILPIGAASIIVAALLVALSKPRAVVPLHGVAIAGMALALSLSGTAAFVGQANATHQLKPVLEAIGPDRPIAAVNYHEDSLIFATRGRLERIDAADMNDWADAHQSGVIIATDDIDPPFGWVRTGAPVEGLNLGKGRRVKLVAFTKVAQ
ncbi:MAG: glycosyltransferase family 39 protein [Planctomycetota bacterium]